MEGNIKGVSDREEEEVKGNKGKGTGKEETEMEEE